MRSAGTDNSFDQLRLLFAALVAIYHVVNLSGVAGWRPVVMPLAYAAEVGVQGFFVVSGYLVYGSLERSRGLSDYAEKRVRRLYPAYAVVILACAIGGLVASAAARADPGSVFAYLGWNLAFLNFMAPELPGVFASNPFPEINGALWTLKIEVMFYFVLPLIAWIIARAGRARWLVIAAIYVAAELWRGGFAHAARVENEALYAVVSRQLPGQLSFFMTGAALYLARDAMRWTPAVIGLAALAFAVSFLGPLGAPLRAASLGVLAIGAAVTGPRLPSVTRAGDLSYGLYIIHFPVIQTLVAMGLFAAAPLAAAALAVALSVGLSALMWRFVERPALRRDSVYRRPG
jgi:peptidoglycan/LPS O-acetylase OafA/YrhL